MGSVAWNKLLYGVVPKFSGLFIKFFTAIRIVIWRITGSFISNCTSAGIGYVVTTLVKNCQFWSWSKIIDVISCFFSAGSMLAGVLDWLDGDFDGKVCLS